MADMDADIAIIGAGVVGLAITQRLARRHAVVLIEQHEGPARETSSHNSQVIHAAIHHETGSLKHQLCWEGNALMYEWADAHHVRVLRSGKLVVAFTEAELPALDEAFAHAKRNEARGVELLTSEQARACEPHVQVAGAMWSPSTGVVDSYALVRSYESEAREHGALIAYQHQVVGIQRGEGGFILALRDADGAESEMRCGALVNAAGHGAPGIATMLGYPLDGGEVDGVEAPMMRQRANRGLYYDIVDPEMKKLITRPIYPLPNYHAGGLGVHLTVDTDGNLHVGPSTEWLEEGAPLDYRNPDDPEWRRQFLEASRRYLPALQDEHIAAGQVGYRPKLQQPGGAPADFLLWKDRGYLHMGGIESPGLTSSLALAREVEERLG